LRDRCKVTKLTSVSLRLCESRARGWRIIRKKGLSMTAATYNETRMVEVFQWQTESEDEIELQDAGFEMREPAVMDVQYDEVG
jgi:hypothetical protein